MTEQLKRYRMHSPDGVAGAMTDMVLASDHAAAVAALEEERDSAIAVLRLEQQHRQNEFTMLHAQLGEAKRERDALSARLAEVERRCMDAQWNGNGPIRAFATELLAALPSEKRGE